MISAAEITLKQFSSVFTSHVTTAYNMRSGGVCVGPVLAHAVPRSADSHLAADMTMWIGPVDYRGGPLSVPCTLHHAIAR